MFDWPTTRTARRVREQTRVCLASFFRNRIRLSATTETLIRQWTVTVAVVLEVAPRLSITVALIKYVPAALYA